MAGAIFGLAPGVANAATAPTVETTPASSVTQAGATLNATVNPEGSEVSACTFEYGTEATYGKTAPCTQTVGAGSNPVSVSATITGLTANTNYHFRISATNAGGKREGADAEFKTTAPVITPPTVKTEPAGFITQKSAAMNATVNPNGSEVTDCHFEYGTTMAYGKTAPCDTAPGSGASSVSVSAAITGLTANTTYHFRISATNSGGTGTGLDREFKTVEAITFPTIEIKPASSITQTTATLNKNGKVKPEVKVIKVKLSGTALLVTVKLSQKGTVRISGKGLRTTIKRNLSAGNHRIRVRLTKSGLAARKHHRKLVMHVALTVLGRSASASKSLRG